MDPRLSMGRDISRAKAQRRKENPLETRQRFAPLREKSFPHKNFLCKDIDPHTNSDLLYLLRAKLPSIKSQRHLDDLTIRILDERYLDVLNWMEELCFGLSEQRCTHRLPG